MGVNCPENNAKFPPSFVQPTVFQSQSWGKDFLSQTFPRARKVNPIKSRSNPSWSFRRVLNCVLSLLDGVIGEQIGPERTRDIPKVT